MHAGDDERLRRCYFVHSRIRRHMHSAREAVEQLVAAGADERQIAALRGKATALAEDANMLAQVLYPTGEPL